MELKRNFKSLIVWTVAVGLSMFVILISYPLVDDVFDQMPQEFIEIVDIFGGIPRNLIEYFAMEGGMIFQLTCALYATLLGFGTITKEEREKSTDLIYTLPVARKTFFLSKMTAGFIQITAFMLGNLIFIVLGIVIINDYASFAKLLLFALLSWVLLMIFVCFGTLLGTLSKKNIKQLNAMAIPLPLYIVSLIASLTDNKWLDALKYLTPYTFSDPLVVLKNGYTFEVVNFLTFTVLAIISFFIAYSTFVKKEFAN